MKSNLQNRTKELNQIESNKTDQSAGEHRTFRCSLRSNGSCNLITTLLLCTFVYTYVYGYDI